MKFIERENVVFNKLSDDEVRKLSTSELKYVCKHALMMIAYKKRKKIYVDPEKLRLSLEDPHRRPLRQHAIRPILNRKGMAEAIIAKRPTVSHEAKVAYLIKTTTRYEKMIAEAEEKLKTCKPFEKEGIVKELAKKKKILEQVNEIKTEVESEGN